MNGDQGPKDFSVGHLMLAILGVIMIAGLCYAGHLEGYW